MVMQIGVVYEIPVSPVIGNQIFLQARLLTVVLYIFTSQITVLPYRQLNPRSVFQYNEQLEFDYNFQI